MEVSLFLAKLMGIYLLIIGLAYFIKREFLRVVLEDFYKSPALIALGSIFNIILGLLIILNHNIWEFSWKIMITIIGYLSLVKGILHLYFPQVARTIASVFIRKDIFVYSGVISLALGVYLLYHGFFDFFHAAF